MCLRTGGLIRRGRLVEVGKARAMNFSEVYLSTLLKTYLLLSDIFGAFS